ncbi:MAG: hypothetical protein AAF193_03080 [Bacteroidota bacterium]
MKKALAILSILIPAFMTAQIMEENLLEGMNMRAVGPGTTSGMVTAIDVVRDDPSTI